MMRLVSRVGGGVPVWVDVVVLEDDPEVADRSVRQLRRELVEQDFETRPVPAVSPDGSKGVAEAIGAVAVALGGAGGAVSVLVALLKDWLGRRSGATAIKLTVGDKSIELDRASSAERQQLIEAFLREGTRE